MKGKRVMITLHQSQPTPPIITSILPAQTLQQTMSSSPSISEGAPTSSAKAWRLNITGPHDANVQAYCNWHQSQVRNESWKIDFQKACNVAIDDGLDLNLIDELNDPDYFNDRGVKWGIAL